MLHYQRNPTVRVPVDVTLYDGLTPMIGEAERVRGNVLCLDNGYRLDSDGAFKLNAASPAFGFNAYSNIANIYYALLDPSGWPRGHYRAFVTHTSGLAFATDFTIGMYVDRKLAYSAAYSGTALKMSFWIEENGDFQTDYRYLRNLVLKSMDGTVIHTFPDLGTSNGLFTLNDDVTLPANSNFILEGNAVVPGPATRPDLVFPLRIGMSRP